MTKLQFLEGLRGCAALSVVFYHYFCAFFTGFNVTTTFIPLLVGISLFNISPFAVIFNGDFPVSVFFILSGFVLSYAYFQTKEMHIIVASALKRYIRFLIPIAFIILLAVILVLFHCYYNIPAANITGSKWLAETQGVKVPTIPSVANQIFYGTLLNGVNDYDGPLWTMSIEFYGSFLVFGFLVLFGNLRTRWLIYLAAFCYFFNSWYQAFIVGMFLCDWYTYRGSKISCSWCSLAGALCIFIGPLIGNFYLETPLFVLSDGTLWTPANMYIEFLVVGASLVVLGILLWDVFQKVLSNTWFGYLGKISFSLYLIHVIILNTFTCWLFTLLYPSTSFSEALIISCGFAIPLTFLISYIFYRLFDDPAIRISGLFSKLMLGEIHLKDTPREIYKVILSIF